MNTFEEIAGRLPEDLRQELESLPQQVVNEIEEIRLRCGQNIRLQTGASEKIICHVVTKEDLIKTLNCLIKFSYYAYEEDLAKGFVTIEGGHRVGICGKAVVKNGQIALIKEISSMNIRFTKEIKGCADKIAGCLTDEHGKPVNTLIVSPPGCGKTTLLRDIVRNLSMHRIKVAVCDERSEIAGMYNSKPSFDLGPGTDVLDGAAKAQGIEMLIRSMSPQVIVTDEIGKKEDLRAIEQCISTGVALITSIHGNCRQNVKESPIGELVERGYFKNLIFLSKEHGPGTVSEVVHA